MQEKHSQIKKAGLIERALLKAMSVRRNYENYNTYVITERLLPETQIVLESYRRYYEMYKEHEAIDFESFLTHWGNTWHREDMTHEDNCLYRDIIIRITEADAVDSEQALMGLINK